MRRFAHFSDDEIYMLSRACIESSFEIVMGDKYDDGNKTIHTDLSNELLKERQDRDYNNAKQCPRNDGKESISASPIISLSNDNGVYLILKCNSNIIYSNQAGTPMDYDEDSIEGSLIPINDIFCYESFKEDFGYHLGVRSGMSKEFIYNTLDKLVKVYFKQETTGYIVEVDRSEWPQESWIHLKFTRNPDTSDIPLNGTLSNLNAQTFDAVLTYPNSCI